MNQLLDMIPDQARRFGVPIGALVTLILVAGLEAVFLQEILTYALLAVTAITFYVEYRRFVKARKVIEGKVTPLDGSGS